MESLLTEARLGATEALGQALQTCRAYLLMVADQEMDRGLRARVAPSDAVQLTFADASLAFGQFRGTTEGELRAWLKCILRNNLHELRAFNHRAIRSVAREGPAAEGAAEPPANVGTPSAEVRKREDAQRLEAALLRLSPDERLIVELHNREGLSFVDAGVRMSRSADAARKLWGRAVRKLQSLLEDSP